MDDYCGGDPVDKLARYLVQTVNTPFHSLPWYSKLWVFAPLQTIKGINKLLEWLT